MSAAERRTSRRKFGSVRQLPSGRWQARYETGGRFRSADETYATKDEAEEALVLIQADLLRGTWRDPEAGLITFREWSAKWMDNAHHLRGRTRYKYESILRRRLNPVFGDMPIAAIQPAHVWDFVAANAATFAASTVATEYSLFRTIMRAAVEIDLIPITPCRGVNLPEGEDKDKRRATIEELAVLVDKTKPRYQAMIWTFGIMGVRWSEAAGLKVGRLSIDGVGPPTMLINRALADVGGKLSMDKTKNASSVRALPLPPVMADILRRHLELYGNRADLDSFVFSRPRGGALDYSDFHHDVWAPAVKAAKLDGLTLHGLRHSSAGLLRQLGLHTQLIARWLGHSDDRMTSKIYGWVPDAVDQAAAKALDEALRKAIWHDTGTTDAAGDGA